jgi:hypothetical protein
MIFASDTRMRLQVQLDRDARAAEMSWCVACGEDEPCATCEDQTDEARFAHKPIFAAAHPRDGSEANFCVELIGAD